MQVVRCCRVKVLIAGLQCRDRRPHKRASRNLCHFTLVRGKSARRGSHISWCKSSARHAVPRATRLPADQQKAFAGHLPLFFPFLLASSELAPPSTRLAVSALQPPAECVTGHHVLLQRPKPVQNRHLQSSSALTLTAGRYFPHEPRMEMAEGESGRL